MRKRYNAIPAAKGKELSRTHLVHFEPGVGLRVINESMIPAPPVRIDKRGSPQLAARIFLELQPQIRVLPCLATILRHIQTARCPGEHPGRMSRSEQGSDKWDIESLIVLLPRFSAIGASHDTA